MKHIKVRGARQHNLKNIDIDIPRDKLVVITGLSGSGKSSLAFDTLYAEGQRRYVESLSAYARQFLSMMEKPDVDHIEGLSPAISIEQKTTSHNPRSTVGTVTEIYDYLRLLFARAGTPICPDHNLSLEGQTSNQICDKILELPKETKLMILAPLIKEQKGEHLHVFEELKMQGYVRMRVDGITVDVDDNPKLNKNKKHSIEAVVDRLILPKEIDENFQLRLAESVENALNLGDGNLIIFLLDENEDISYSSKMACNKCGYSIPELEPRLFTFNNPAGACSDCEGLGVKQYVDVSKVIHEPTASLSEGAIVGWDISHRYHFHLIRCLSKEYAFSLDVPFEDLSDEVKDILLNGTRGASINFSWRNKRGSVVERIFPFEGIISNIERRYKETESSWSRDNLSKLISLSSCKACSGTRLRKEARNVFIDDVSLPEITSYTIDQSFKFFSGLNLKGSKKEIAERIIKEVNERLEFLIDVGLNYLTLDRSAESLSGGEAQRIRLASQIGAGLVGVTYILDEPSIGLHQRDNSKLIKTLNHLKNLGNTVIVVEHDEEAIRSADHIIDIGPGAGKHGGEICASGTIEDILNNQQSITGQYLSGKKGIAIPKKRTKKSSAYVSIINASENNLKNVTVDIPIGLFTCITGVSGSGKSSLINQTLLPISSFMLNKAKLTKEIKCEKVEGLDYLDKVISIDQSPIGRTPRSNPATYTGLFSYIRDLFAESVEAKSRGYKPGRFSFNVKGG